MASRKNPLIVATSAERPGLTTTSILTAASEANLLASELINAGQISRRLPEGERLKLDKPLVNRLRGLIDILAGEE